MITAKRCLWEPKWRLQGSSLPGGGQAASSSSRAFNRNLQRSHDRQPPVKPEAQQRRHGIDARCPSKLPTHLCSHERHGPCRWHQYLVTFQLGPLCSSKLILVPVILICQETRDTVYMKTSPRTISPKNLSRVNVMAKTKDICVFLNPDLFFVCHLHVIVVCVSITTKSSASRVRSSWETKAIQWRRHLRRNTRNKIQVFCDHLLALPS